MAEPSTEQDLLAEYLAYQQTRQSWAPEAEAYLREVAETRAAWPEKV